MKNKNMCSLIPNKELGLFSFLLLLLRIRGRTAEKKLENLGGQFEMSDFDNYILGTQTPESVLLHEINARW